MITASLVAALILALVYALGGWLRTADRDAAAGSRRRWWMSAAAGASVAYVFVDILPELGARHRSLVEAAGEGLMFAEQRVYVVALAGFIVFYGLEHMVLTTRRDGRAGLPAGHSRGVYGLHIGGLAAYSWLIGYLLVPRSADGTMALALYSAAMAFHFLVIDHTLLEEHGRPYDRGGRWLLAGIVLVGWLSGAVGRVPEAVLTRLFALLAGGVVITSVKAEMPSEREGRFWPFCLGAAAYSILLLTA